MVQGWVEDTNGEDDGECSSVLAGLHINPINIHKQHHHIDNLHEAANLMERQRVLIPLELQKLSDRLSTEDIELVRLVEQLHEADVCVLVLEFTGLVISADVEADLWQQVAAIFDFENFATVNLFSLVVILGLFFDGLVFLLIENLCIFVSDLEQGIVVGLDVHVVVGVGAGPLIIIKGV